MSHSSSGLVQTLLGLPIFQAEWVLWLLFALSAVSVAVVVERLVFYRRHKVDLDKVKERFTDLINAGDFAEAAAYLKNYDSLETNVVLYALRSHELGPDSVEDLLGGAARKEKGRFERRLGFLATVASNAPFIGLFGTVLGIIRAFNDLAGNMNEASTAVMGGIAEALIATAVGLMVAIPAVIAFNAFKGRVNHLVDNMHFLAASLLANLKAEGSVGRPHQTALAGKEG